MKKLKVELGERSYYIWIEKGILSKAGKIVGPLKLAQAAYVITNSKIKSIYGYLLKRSLVQQGLQVKFCTVADSEKSKSYSTWIKVLNDLAYFDRGKGVVVIALGGGVIGDLSGFVAATYRRGVPLVQIPTTLLAQVDSAIGGKAAIDIASAKNIVGAFYQPNVVLSDISTLKTLPKRQLLNGLAEVIKYGVIWDKGLFSYIENNVSKILRLDTNSIEYLVWNCSRLKADVVSVDEKEELGYRSILNFGHTTGHAIEAAVSYRKSISHGEAICVGMLVAFDIAVSLGLIKESVAIRVENLIKKIGLPPLIKGIDISKAIKAISYDKKTIKGKKRWVLPIDIGHVIVCYDLPFGAIINAIKKRIKS